MNGRLQKTRNTNNNTRKSRKLVHLSSQKKVISFNIHNINRHNTTREQDIIKSVCIDLYIMVGPMERRYKYIPEMPPDILADNFANSAAASFAFFAAKDLASKASLFHYGGKKQNKTIRCHFPHIS